MHMTSACNGLLNRCALCLAHRAMALESIQRTQVLPKYYLKADVYSKDFENKDRSYIFIDGDVYTYWFDQGDHGPWWTGRTGNGLEELIRIYYTEKLKENMLCSRAKLLVENLAR